MNPCMVSTGFFVLGRCGKAAVAACPRCGRHVCAEHAAPDGTCPECAAQRYGGGDVYHPSWTRRYRRWYYQRSSQQYSDTYWYSDFDSYDRGSFNPEDAHTPDYSPDDGDGWVDS